MFNQNNTVSNPDWLTTIKSELPIARDVFAFDYANERPDSVSVTAINIPQLTFLSPSSKHIGGELNSGEKYVRSHFEH